MFRKILSLLWALGFSCSVSSATNHYNHGDIHIVKSANDLEMIFVSTPDNIGTATFTKGSPEGEAGRLVDENQHEVTLTRGYFLGQNEVTQAEYDAVMRGNLNGLPERPSNSKNNANQPVENVSWDDIQIFLEVLNDKEKSSGNLAHNWSYTLPTEAEWEYACRAGKTTPYHTGNTIESNQSNFRIDSNTRPLVVGKTSPNPWGFYDMHGNVREWSNDWYVADLQGSYCDPQGPTYSEDSNGKYRDPRNLDNLTFSPKKVCKGGSFNSDPLDVRSARRYSEFKDARKSDLGFRLALRRTDYDAVLEYANVGKSVAVHSGNRIKIETAWEDSGDYKIITAPSETIAELLGADGFAFDEIYIFPFTSTENSKFQRPIEQNSLQFEPVAEYAFNVSAVSTDADGSYSYFDEILTSEQMNSFIDSSDSLHLEYRSEEFNSNYSIEAAEFAFLSLFSDSLSERFAQFLNQGDQLTSPAGWMWADWFGYYYANHFPWIYHENLGWAFVKQDQADNTWLYRENLGWAWTTANDWWVDHNQSANTDLSSYSPFPFLYRFGYDENDTKVWTYLSPNYPQATLYDFDMDEWFKLDQPYQINVSAVPTVAGNATGTGKYHHWEKVSLLASPNNNYNFLNWSNDLNGGLKTQFFANSNLDIQASFLPVTLPNQTNDNIAEQYKEMLSYREDLTELQKEQALLELLLFGKSQTAGINN